MMNRPESICAGYDWSIIVVRWGALVIDVIARIAVIAIMVSLSPMSALPVTIAMCALFYIAYYPVLEGLTGQTLGKFICGLRVVKANGEAPGIVGGILRTVARLAEIDPFLFGGFPAAIIVANNPKRQRLGDIMAGTFVVRVSDLKHNREHWKSAYDLPVPTVHGFDLPAHSGAIDPIPVRPYAALFCWGALLMLPALSLLFSGFEAHRTGPPKAPTTITCKSLLSSPIKPGWYHITDIPLNIAYARYVQPDSSSFETGTNSSDSSAYKPDLPITEIYAPVPANDEHDTAQLIIVTSEDGIVDNVKALMTADSKGESATRAYVKQHMDRITYPAQFTGMISEGDKISDVTAITTFSPGSFRLAPKFRVLHVGETPTPTFPTAAFSVGGIFALASGICLLLGTRKFLQ